MEMEPIAPALLVHFADLPDPRVQRRRQHALLDILVISLLAVLCGAEGWDDMSRFGRAKADWLKARLGLSLAGGVPSSDTFRRVFARLDPARFGSCFRSWVDTLRQLTGGQVIALDGKAIRHSFDTAMGQPAMHLVRAWAAEEQLVLGAVKVAEGSNEIPAVAALLSLLDLGGSIITADALHCQRATAAQIVASGGDYLLSVKENQPHLLQDLCGCFAQRERHPAAPKEWVQAVAGRSHTTDTQTDYGHGRIETRAVEVLVLAPEDPDWHDVQQAWRGLRSLVRLTRTRRIRETESTETVYYICSLAASARAVSRAIRRHWHIENKVHWVLDVQMNEDASRIRKDHAPENLALLRNMALNLLRQDKSRYGGVKARQKLAGWDNEYLLQLIA